MRSRVEIVSLRVRDSIILIESLPFFLKKKINLYTFNQEMKKKLRNSKNSAFQSQAWLSFIEPGFGFLQSVWFSTTDIETGCQAKDEASMSSWVLFLQQLCHNQWQHLFYQH